MWSLVIKDRPAASALEATHSPTGALLLLVGPKRRAQDYMKAQGGALWTQTRYPVRGDGSLASLFTSVPCGL